MGLITGWILSIVGVVLIGVLVDLILPEGQMQKYIKAIFGVFIVFTLVTPLLNLKISEIDFNKFIYNENSIEVNQNYINNYNNEYKKYLENLVEDGLKYLGFNNVLVEIYNDLSKNEFTIKKVLLNAKKLVININSVHIDKYKEMKKIVVSILNVKEDLIVIDEWRKEK